VLRIDKKSNEQATQAVIDNSLIYLFLAHFILCNAL